MRWAKNIVRHRAFEAFMACAIMVNGIVLVLETDLREDDEFVWLLLDWLFTVTFLLEMLLRMAAMRSKWHKSAWNLFDAVLVVISLVDMVILPLLQESFEFRIFSVFRVIRIFRMLRILRLLRVFRFAHQLVLLLYAIFSAMRAMFWAMVLITLVLYTFGMLLTRVVGKNCCEEDDLFQDPRMLEWYGTLPRSLFTLFQFTTLEGWPEIARPTLTSHPWLTAFYIFFIMVTSISLLNTVAGVLTESILETSRRKHQETQDKEERELQEHLHQIAQKFTEREGAGSHRVRFDEFVHFAEQSGPLRDFLKKVRYMDDKGNMEPALDLFRLLEDEDETVSFESYVEAVWNSRGPVKSKHLLAVKREVRRSERLLREANVLLERVGTQLLDLQERQFPATAAPHQRSTSSTSGISSGCAPGGTPQESPDPALGPAAAEAAEASGGSPQACHSSGSSVGVQRPRPGPLAKLRSRRGGEDQDSVDALRLEFHERLAALSGRVEWRLKGVDASQGDPPQGDLAASPKRQSLRTLSSNKIGSAMWNSENSNFRDCPTPSGSPAGNCVVS